MQRKPRCDEVMSISLPLKLRKVIEAEAEREDRSVSAQVRVLLLRAMKEQAGDQSAA
jgi:hypothetical protein